VSNINKEGDYSDALKDLETMGGILFAPKENSVKEPTILQVGAKTITYWHPESKPYREWLIELASRLQIPPRDLGNPWNLTSGRLARIFLQKVIKAKNFNADPHPKKYAKYVGKEKYLSMARDGSHWHFEYVWVGEPVYAIELDLKAAYFTSLTNFESIFLHERMGFRPDGEALNRLRQFAPVLSESDANKKFRLQLVGIMAQHEKRYEKIDKQTNMIVKAAHEDYEEWGSGFNTAHQAIKNVHTVMTHCSQMLGKYLIRSHTDCLLIRTDCPEEVEKRVVDYVNQKGFTLSCKTGKAGYRIGLSKFWDLNTGFIGRYPIPKNQGADIKEKIEEDGIDLQEIYKPIPQEIINRWQHWLV